MWLCGGVKKCFVRTVALPEATGLAVLWLGGRLVLGVWPASLPEACHVVWTSGPWRLARLFEASWVELIAAPLKATSRKLHLDHDLASFWKEKTLLGESWKRPCMPQGIRRRAPAEGEKHEAWTRCFREKGSPDRAAEPTCS